MKENRMVFSCTGTPCPQLLLLLFPYIFTSIPVLSFSLHSLTKG